MGPARIRIVANERDAREEIAIGLAVDLAQALDRGGLVVFLLRLLSLEAVGADDPEVLAVERDALDVALDGGVGLELDEVREIEALVVRERACAGRGQSLDRGGLVGGEE